MPKLRSALARLVAMAVLIGIGFVLNATLRDEPPAPAPVVSAPTQPVSPGAILAPIPKPEVRTEVVTETYTVEVPMKMPTEPCATEDSPGPCFWDAGQRGNGRGFSFWIDKNGCRHYLDAANPRTKQRRCV